MACADWTERPWILGRILSSFHFLHLSYAWQYRYHRYHLFIIPTHRLLRKHRPRHFFLLICMILDLEQKRHLREDIGMIATLVGTCWKKPCDFREIYIWGKKHQQGATRCFRTSVGMPLSPKAYFLVTTWCDYKKFSFLKEVLTGVGYIPMSPLKHLSCFNSETL